MAYTPELSQIGSATLTKTRMVKEKTPVQDIGGAFVRDRKDDGRDQTR